MQLMGCRGPLVSCEGSSWPHSLQPIHTTKLLRGRALSYVGGMVICIETFGGGGVVAESGHLVLQAAAFQD